MGSIINHLIGKGAGPGLADAICGGSGQSSNTLTAAGASQSTATLIQSGSVYVSVVSSSGKGVQLPLCDPNSSVDLFNGGTNTLYVYGQSGENIANTGSNAAYSVAAGKSARFCKYSSTVWGANKSA